MITFDDRGKRSNSLRATLEKAAYGDDRDFRFSEGSPPAERSAVNEARSFLPRRGASPQEDFVANVRALGKLKERGVISQASFDLMVVGLRSTMNGILRCQRDMPLEVVRDPTYGINVIKPV